MNFKTMSTLEAAKNSQEGMAEHDSNARKRIFIEVQRPEYLNFCHSADQLDLWKSLTLKKNNKVVS